MIGANDFFGEIFGSVPAGEVEWNARVAKAAVRAGLAVVLIYPHGKIAACTLTSAQAQKANVAAQDAAKAAGNLGWQAVIHACGVDHAITEEKQLTHVKVKELLADGANLAIAPGKSSRRMLVVDIDTGSQLSEFHKTCESFDDLALRNEPLTVSSPGVFRESWVHKDGGHYWFEVPEDVELPGNIGKITWCRCHGYRPFIPDPETGRKISCPNAWAAYWGSGYVLVPPSARPEGAYRLTGSAVAAPEWLIGLCQGVTADRPTRDGTDAFSRFEDDPIDSWSAEMSWADLLIPDGFTPAGRDNCGCPTYTRPGDATHGKSVTAHEPGCTLAWPHGASNGHLPMMIWSDALGGQRAMSKLSWYAYSRDISVAEAMDFLGIRQLHEHANLALEMDMVHVPKASASVTDGLIFDVEVVEDQTDPVADASPINAMSVTQYWESEDNPYAASPTLREMFVREVGRQFVAGVAKDFVKELTVRQSWTPPDDEDDLEILFKEPPNPIKYRLAGLLPVRGNLMISAQYKSGKTTLVLEFLRAFADRVPFLGMYEPVDVTGRVALWNYELDRDMMTEWIRETGIQNPGNIRLLNLRGRRIPLDTKPGRDFAVKWLSERNIKQWIIDPAVRALIGFGSENSNDDVTIFTDVLDEIKERAGVDELIIAHHTGRAEMEMGAERARGATRWDDWPDVRAILTVEMNSGTRFLAFKGRFDGGEIPERALAYAAPQRRLSIVGGGDPLLTADRRTLRDVTLRATVLAAITETPGMNTRQLITATNLSERDTAKAVSGLESAGAIRIEPGSNRQKFHFPAGAQIDGESQTAITDGR